MPFWISPHSKQENAHGPPRRANRLPAHGHRHGVRTSIRVAMDLMGFVASGILPSLAKGATPDPVAACGTVLAATAAGHLPAAPVAEVTTEPPRCRLRADRLTAPGRALRRALRPRGTPGPRASRRPRRSCPPPRLSPQRRPRRPPHQAPLCPRHKVLRKSRPRSSRLSPRRRPAICGTGRHASGDDAWRQWHSRAPGRDIAGTLSLRAIDPMSQANWPLGPAPNAGCAGHGVGPFPRRSSADPTGAGTVPTPLVAGGPVDALLEDFPLGRVRVIAQDIQRMHRLAPLRVRPADHGHIFDLGMRSKDVLDLAGIDVLATGNDHVGLAIDGPFGGRPAGRKCAANKLSLTGMWSRVTLL